MLSALVENIVQAISRDILAYAMKSLRDMRIVAHVHDELIMNTYPRRILEDKTPLGKLEEELGFIPVFFKPRTWEVCYG